MFLNSECSFLVHFITPKARFRKDWLHTVVGFEFVSRHVDAMLFGDFRWMFRRVYGAWFSHDMRTFFRDTFSDHAALADLMVCGGGEL